MPSLSPQQLAHVVASGLLSFPVTDFDATNAFDAAGYRARLEWLKPHGAAALFAAGGTGEFFSLSQREYAAVIGAAVDACRGHTPIIAGAGYGTATAIEYAREAERLGADGILLLPHYLTESSQEGLRAHVTAVCKATRLGVIVYNRANMRLNATTLARVADDCPNLAGFKDGVGDIETMVSIRAKLGDRLAYVGGLPTAEVYAAAYKAMGVPTYSSAVFNFVPRTALEFHRAIARDDRACVDRLLASFFMPYLDIRNRQPGYAVSIVKAGVRIVGKPAGHVRPPLTDLTDVERDALAALIATLGPQ
jgi:5-dehydro-4-deoxyglucarate dehydratase